MYEEIEDTGLLMTSGKRNSWAKITLIPSKYTDSIDSNKFNKYHFIELCARLIGLLCARHLAKQLTCIHLFSYSQPRFLVGTAKFCLNSKMLVCLQVSMFGNWVCFTVNMYI